jgi:hypothetical protein
MSVPKLLRFTQHKYSDTAIPKRLRVKHSKISVAWPGMMLIARKISGLKLNRLYVDYPIINKGQRTSNNCYSHNWNFLYQAHHRHVGAYYWSSVSYVHPSKVLIRSEMACVPTLHENKESAAYTAQQPAGPTFKLNQNNAASLHSRYVLEAYSSNLDPVTFYTEMNIHSTYMFIRPDKKKQPMEAYSQNLIYSSLSLRGSIPLCIWEKWYKIFITVETQPFLFDGEDPLLWSFGGI